LIIDRKTEFYDRDFHALITADKICDFVGSFLRVDSLRSSWWCFFGGKATEKTDWISYSGGLLYFGRHL
jgi:hypothetical protein